VLGPSTMLEKLWGPCMCEQMRTCADQRGDDLALAVRKAVDVLAAERQVTRG